MSRRWKIDATLVFPARMQGVIPGENPNELPKKLGRKQVLHDRQRATINGRGYLLKPYGGPALPSDGHQFEPASLITSVKATHSTEAVGAVELDMDDILSDLSFQIQHPVLVCRLEVIDLTEPVQIGDTRECLLFRYPQGYKTPKFQLSNYIGNVEAIEQPELRTTDGSSKFSHALRWYVKGLAAQTDAAKFMFFWIALEILVTAAGEKVTLPYRAPCGHEILSCPECGKETQRRMGGAEIQRYLVDQFAISEEEAKKLWNFRQIMHGANRLTRQSIADLPGHTALCWSLAAAALKQAMGHRQEELPTVRQQALGVTNISLGMRRALTEHDLDLGA